MPDLMRSAEKAPLRPVRLGTFDAVVERDADGYVIGIDNIPLLATMAEAMDALT